VISVLILAKSVTLAQVMRPILHRCTSNHLTPHTSHLTPQTVQIIFARQRPRWSFSAAAGRDVPLQGARHAAR
jgi:hypothetical protein